MLKHTLDDTIAAISTPVGDGGIGIVRLSGRDSLGIAGKIFKAKDGKQPSDFKSYTTHYGHIIDRISDPSGNGIVIDEVILTIMRAPRSYTKEDIIEINCHGGITPLRKVLELVFSLGARMAEPGEFTKRAFLNGRIDLAQAESVLDLIRSKTDTGLRAAMGQLEGALSSDIKRLRDGLVEIASHIEASIDFPEEDIETLSGSGIKLKIEEMMDEIKKLIDGADRGRILKEGIRTVICGRPNVGKSSLMNSLLREKRVIVSHIPSTTRDVIEEIINIDGIPLKIVDTAGIIETNDLLTKEGVKRSRFYISTADLILFLLDRSEPLSMGDKVIMDEIKDKKVIVVINKADLPKRLEVGQIRKILHDKRMIEISVTEERNLKELEGAISEMVWGGVISADHTVMVTNSRHKALLGRTKDVLTRFLKNFAEKAPPEFLMLEVEEAIDSLGEITGESIDTDILDKIFNDFCVGK